MHLEQKEQEELNRRKGLTLRTIIQIIWLIISFGLAYLLTNSLESENVFSYGQLYRSLSIPATVPRWAVQGAMMLIVVIIMQFLFFVIFALFSPEGRRKPGEPTLYSRTKDPFDRGY
jgi:hypothetical protein